MEVVLLAAGLNTLLPRLWENRKDEKKLRYAIDVNIEAIGRQINRLETALEAGKFKGDGTGSALKREARELSQQTRDCIQRFFKNKKASCTEFAVKTEAYGKAIQQLCERLEGHASPETVSRKPQDPYVAHPMGMAEPMEELLKLVRLPGRPSDGRRKVISIVGFGGLGKTLLAKLVYDRIAREASELSPETPDCTLRARVTAAIKDANEVLREILKQVDTEGEHENLNLENLGQLLAERLRGKRYLIVIDDMQNMGLWNSINDVFPKDGDGDGTIIVTTTIQSVANVCSSCNGYVYRLSPLDEDRSVDLFLKDRTSWDRRLIQQNALDILEKCDGLPLAIVSMSQIMQGRGGLTSGTCKDAFKQVGASLVKEGGDLERLRWVLMNKYTSLTGDALRSCLLYFCMYKNKMDAVPRMSLLIRRWEAEGFLVAKYGSTRPTDVAAKNLKTLVDRNIIQSMEVGTNGSTRRCRPPGIMVEFISQISMFENFAALVSDVAEAEPLSSIRRLSVHPGSDTDDKKLSAMELSLVLTLAVSGIGCEAILKFKRFELIAVLDLKECTNLNDSHVIDICKLLLLKYLSLGETIGEIPRDIGDLILLETLEMRRNKVVFVYAELLELPNLKHLLGKFELKKNPDERLKNFLSNTSDIETITAFVTYTTRGFPQLMHHMKRLKKVKIYCTPTATERDQKDLQTEIKAFTRQSMNEVSYDRSLSIDFTEFTRETMCSSRPFQALDHSKQLPSPLEFLIEPGSLDSLKLRGDWTPFLLENRHNWRPFVGAIPDFSKISRIKKLCLSRTYLSGAAVLAGLSNLIALEYLKLDEQDLGPLEIKIKSQSFQKLTRLCLVGERSLHGITIEHGALPGLVSLHIICKAMHRGLESSIASGRVKRLNEIALDSEVDKNIKDAWKIAAKGHPNRPHVLLIKKGISVHQA